MLRVTLTKAGFGDKLIDITGLITLADVLNIKVEIHWILLEKKERFAYSPSLISIHNPDVFIVPRREGAFANTVEMSTSGVLSPSIVQAAVASLRITNGDHKTELLQITSEWLKNLRKIQLNPHISTIVPSCIEGSIGIHLRRSDKLRNDGRLSWNDMDVEHYDSMMNNLMHKVIDMVANHTTGMLSFFICSEDLPFKASFKEWLLRIVEDRGKTELCHVITIEKEDIPIQLRTDFSNIYDVVEWYALTRCKCIFQGINYSTYSMTASMWANIPLHNFTEKCSDDWLTHLWKPCLKLVHCDKMFNHNVNFKTLSRYNAIAPVLPRSILRYALCKVFCLTKNEYDLLEDFINFYGSLFGYNNVVLIDNGSTHPTIPEVYRKYESRGVHIHSDTRQMRKQADMMTDCMRLYQNECEFMLPLDTDEFIYTLHGSPLTRDTLARLLNDVPKVFSGVFYNHVLDSVVDPLDPSYKNFCHMNPVRTMTKFRSSSIQKVIVRSSAFNYMIMGNHEANTHYGYRMVSNDLGLLHFHNTGPARKYERALQTITELGFIQPDLANIPQLIVDCQAFVPCVGGHAYKQFIAFLVRMLAIATWTQLHNRLPTPEEIRAVDQAKDDPNVIERISELGKLALSGKTPTKDDKETNVYDVIFGNWPTTPWEVEIDQVARYMDSLP